MAYGEHSHQWHTAETKVYRDSRQNIKNIVIVRYCFCGEIEETIINQSNQYT